MWGHWGAALPDWVLFSLPDGVRVSGYSLFGRLWRLDPGSRMFAGRDGPFLAIGGELAQWVGGSRTFDWVDVAVCGRRAGEPLVRWWYGSGHGA